ncbi:MAG: CoA-binding protein [Cyclobacteriaceae bacterium]|nr:CoA-binding protein [Cyclobacteriaceae bacterium]
MNNSKKTVLIGATTNTERYAYKAAERLTGAQIEFVPVGLKKGEVFGMPILPIKEKPMVNGVHTVTMYIGPQNQPEWYNYILSLTPKRILFNPGTENEVLQEMARKQNIEVVEGCTLVMLGVGTY